VASIYTAAAAGVNKFSVAVKPDQYNFIDGIAKKLNDPTPK